MTTLAHRHIRHKMQFKAVYVAMLILSLHWATVTYVNSTYLSEFVSSEVIGALYTIGSALTILAFFFITKVLKKLGNYYLTFGLGLTEVVVLIALAYTDSMRFVIPLFVIHHAITPLLLFNIDVFMESYIGGKEERTGGRRGLLLTVMSIAGAIAPLISGFLIGDAVPRYHLVYVAGAILMLPFLYIMYSRFMTFKDPVYADLEVLAPMRHFWLHKDLRFVFIAHFLLQLFFAWMVIYTPLYLATVIGFGWEEIGIILFFGLMAYVMFEYPIGEIADKYIGEKEMMAIGFLIMSITTAWLSFIGIAAIAPWMIALFLTRVGAALVETTTESYFFKHIEASDANVISFFRITRPLAYLIGALLGSLTLLFVPLPSLFFVLGILLLPGIVLALLLKDTR